ncbi:N-acetylmuramoyl-L-alanine amidase family protein [Tenacibaculum discolor]|uniref:N-acetylmuramoyl-L-alanine amidase n=1 Tax=Tenacibaculum discolor TaxID=361581 RepID=A0A2G1BRN0_9FLAO|nr:N-acetylmuramoyl-L-alanine amidase [Tenacibaculum discolor]MDP2542208.1 N-acetylmuramoyl-L-alanine amidase [Tenacibaculum discolor]PHN96710.1 N-acetylmuramoyl-L-alanine amidase [Tenacibaculum discolor]PHN99484.1 N-acetylmuramoyl-L-alanine amidase [Rhodobacteraceae bacterium 4F10]
MQFLNFRKYNISKLSLIILTSLTILYGGILSVSAQKKYTVVLDAGHGGKDPGNLGNGFREKNIALRVALDVGKELLTSKDIEVVYTRKKDVFVELHNRAKIANDKKADLFVSIHCDAFRRPDPHGASTFVLGLSGNKENLEIAKKENSVILLEDNYKQNYDYDPNSPESVIGLSVLQEENLENSLGIAGLVQNNFVAIKRNNRKVKQANFLVLRETVMPSVLIELGFLTNKNEGKFLNSRKGQIRMAKSIAQAIRKYFERLKLNTISETLTVNAPLVENEISKPIVKKEVPKQVVKKETRPKTKTIESKTVSKGVVFRVQIAASRKKLSTNSFKGLENVESLFIDDYYKYYYGNSPSLSGIKKVLPEVRSKGYKDAWVVAFKNGKRVSIKEALKNR